MAQLHRSLSPQRIVERTSSRTMSVTIPRLPTGWRFAVFCCCFSIIHCKPDGPSFATISTHNQQESQIFPSKDVRQADGHYGSWSQPYGTTAVASDPRMPSPTFASGGAARPKEDYFPYQYEFGTADTLEVPHHVSSSSHGTENAVGSITKHFATVSFIGLLLLFAIVQNSISTHQRKDALLSARKKRDLVDLNGAADYTKEILNEDLNIRCIEETTLYLENKKLRKRLGQFFSKLFDTDGQKLPQSFSRRCRSGGSPRQRLPHHLQRLQPPSQPLRK